MAPAGSKNLKQVLDRLQRHYHDTNSFTANFREDVTTAGAPTRTRKGAVSFRKPGRMRWEFTDPDKETIVRDLVSARNRQYQPRVQGGLR